MKTAKHTYQFPYNIIFTAVVSVKIPSSTAVDIFLKKLWKISEMLPSPVDNACCCFKITTSHTVIYHRPGWHVINLAILSPTKTTAQSFITTTQKMIFRQKLFF